MRRRRGFVLVMTLFVLAMVVLALAGFARHSLKFAVDASQLERDQQVKWGRASCQRVALGHCRELLDRLDADDSPNSEDKIATKTELVVRLAGMDYWVTLADESAKANPNQILAVTSKSLTTHLLRRLSGSSGVVRLDPQPITQSPVAANDRLPTWDAVFRESSGRSLSPSEILPLVDRITLWSGKLNYHSADEDALFETVRAIAGSIIANRVIQTRQDAPEQSVSQLLATIEANERQRELLVKILSDESDAYGVWVRTFDGRQNYYDFAVKRYYSPTLFRIYTLGW